MPNIDNYRKGVLLFQVAILKGDYPGQFMFGMLGFRSANVHNHVPS